MLAIIEDFREFSRRYSRAERMHANARATDRDSSRADDAISLKQAIEVEFAQCFVRVRPPNWIDVDRMAAGDVVG